MSNTHAISLKRSGALAAALAFMAVLFAVNFASIFSAQAGAAQLTTRSLTLSSTLVGTETGDGVQGSETNGADAVYSFTFTKSATSVQSIQLEFCDDPLDSCVAPTGLDVSSATVGGALASLGAAGTNDTNERGWSFAANTTATPITITLTGVTNPTVVGTFFVRIFTYSDAATTTEVDYGNVASSITEGIEITARVKETLGFSTTGDTETSVSGIGAPGATCDPLTGAGAITLGDPVENSLAINAMYDNYSAFRTYTNALNGMDVTYEGLTLTSGANTIDASATETAFTAGTEQFGLAIDGVVGTNATAPVTSFGGGDVADFTNANQAADFTGGEPGELVADADYDEGAVGTDEFTFVAGSPQVLATSTGYVDCVTVPVRYAANISPITPAGVYTTTVVYTAVPRF